MLTDDDGIYYLIETDIGLVGRLTAARVQSVMSCGYWDHDVDEVLFAKAKALLDEDDGEEVDDENDARL